MNTYPTHRFLLSSSLLILGACGTSVLGGGTGGTSATTTTGSGAGSYTTGSGAGGGGAGAGSGGSGGGCVNSPGDHTISTTGLSLACTQDSDCVGVHGGSACDFCLCPNDSIAASDLGKYDQELVAKKAGCCTAACNAQCTMLPVRCNQGTCVVTCGGTTCAPSEVCVSTVVSGEVGSACAPNPCAPGALACACAASLCGAQQCSGAEGHTVVCR